jgi:hypothetical protein
VPEFKLGLFMVHSQICYIGVKRHVLKKVSYSVRHDLTGSLLTERVGILRRITRSSTETGIYLKSSPTYNRGMVVSGNNVIHDET